MSNRRFNGLVHRQAKAKSLSLPAEQAVKTSVSINKNSFIK